MPTNIQQWKTYLRCFIVSSLFLESINQCFQLFLHDSSMACMAEKGLNQERVIHRISGHTSRPRSCRMYPPKPPCNPPPPPGRPSLGPKSIGNTRRRRKIFFRLY